MSGYHKKNTARDPKEKLNVVLNGWTRTETLLEYCRESGITHGQFYQWKRRLLIDGPLLFAHGGIRKEIERWERRVKALEQKILHLTETLHRERKQNCTPLRQRSQEKIRSDQKWVSLIEQCKLAHPRWGYRRIWQHLRDSGHNIEKKAVYRLMQENQLFTGRRRKKV